VRIQNILRLVALGLICVLILGAAACKSRTPTTATTTTSSPIGGALVNSDSIVTAKIQTIQKQTTGYPWTVNVLIQSSVDVDSLVNPTKDSVGKVITVKTDQDMTSFKTGDVVTAKVKYTGDVNTPGGVNLYMYNIALQVYP
jgi:hypothetical protein